MSAKHTPGPWGYAKSDFDHGFSVYANGPLAYTAGADDYRECAEPNARLIAAAPELLVALEDALLLHEASCACDVREDESGRASRLCPEWVAQARAALAKARGEST